VIDITASALDNISSRNANYETVESIIVAAIKKLDDDMQKEISRLSNLSESMGYVDACTFQDPNSDISNEMTIYCGSPISAKYANCIVRFNNVVELVNRLRISGELTKKQRDEAVSAYTRKLKRAAIFIVNNCDKSFFKYINERNAAAKKDEAKAEVKTEAKAAE
jgi:hypothetical protein